MWVLAGELAVRGFPRGGMVDIAEDEWLSLRVTTGSRGGGRFEDSPRLSLEPLEPSKQVVNSWVSKSISRSPDMALFDLSCDDGFGGLGPSKLNQSYRPIQWLDECG